MRMLFFEDIHVQCPGESTHASVLPEHVFGEQYIGANNFPLITVHREFRRMVEDYSIAAQ